MTRNVVYRGAPGSREEQYGAHIMHHFSGDDSLVGRISDCEFVDVGQAFNLGRYAIHFHLIGEVHKSYVKRVSFRWGFNRAVTFHGISYLKVEDNVALNVMGHNFFIEDGIEENNEITRNLGINTLRSWSLRNTDQTPGTFWLTNPNNHFVGNHAAGSARYGFWFDL
jgi:hypothetical protein